MNRAELLDRLQGTEWVDFELKSAGGGVPEDALKTVSAFANSGGGWLVFGVRELAGAYEVVGIADIDRFQNDLLSACRTADKLRRPASIHPRLFRFDEGWVLALRVDEAARFDKPVRVRVKGRWQAYVRVGAADHRCTPEEEGRFVRDATLTGFDQTPCPDFSLDDLDGEAIRWLHGLIALRSPGGADPAANVATWLKGSGLLLKDGSLTHAAAFLFGKSNVMASLLPGGVVDLRVMHSPSADGMPAHRWDDRELCDGHVCGALRSLYERFHRLCPQPFAFEPEGPHRRARSPEEEVMREALVNLVVHQDYADVRRTATILWWSDRVVFSNPGDSYVDTADLWAGGFSETRNSLMIRLLRQAGLAEQAGSGLPFIQRTWIGTGRPAPGLDNDKGRKRFEVSFLWNGGVNDGVSGDEGVNDGVSEGVNSRSGSSDVEEQILALLGSQPGPRTPSLAAQLGVSISTVERALKALKANGRVTFRGAPKTGGYFISSQRQDHDDQG